jgi:hypothetical protein
MGFLGCLTLVLVAAKVFGFAHYSWLIALSPVFVALGIVAVTILLGIIAAIVSSK